MLLTAAVTKEEIGALVGALTPLAVAIDAQRGRSIALGRPRLELVPDAGLRLRGDARVTWDVAGVAIPVTLEAWQLLLVPRVVTREPRRVLALEPVIERLDLKGVPAFVDGKIARAIGGAVAQHREKLVWNFAETLSRRLALPARIGGGTFALSAVDGAVAVSAEDVKLTLRFEAAIARDTAPRSRRAPISERRAEIG
ncbi:MAG: hypothetical protein KIT84_02305 [Labilithrix sp.]|nr:hypothetical protein [Labilithrix sp.]MCW5809817.1 hypothetical protein [Labilithrix sp.]